MPIELVKVEGRRPRLVLQGIVAPEEVDLLHELIRDNPGAEADLAACEHLHTAALQLLLLAKIPAVSLPEDSFWHHFFTLKETLPDEDDSAG